jgi:ribosomal protein L32E
VRQKAAAAIAAPVGAKYRLIIPPKARTGRVEILAARLNAA